MKNNEIPSVVLIGEGGLASACAEALTGCAALECYPELPAAIESLRPDLVISAFDYPALAKASALNQRLHSLGIHYLPVWVEFGEGRLGPWVTPGDACLACAEVRRITAHPFKQYFSAVLEAAQTNPAPNPWSLRLSLELMAALVKSEILLFSRGEPVRLKRCIATLDLAGLGLQWHPFLPVRHCAVCGELPEDSAESARIDLNRSLPAGGSGWRILDFSTRKGELEAQFVEARTGIATRIGTDITTPLCAVGCARFPFPEDQKEDWGAGLTLCAEKSQAVAILEVLERYGGLRPRAKKTAVFGSYSQLAGEALDPRELILYSEDQYRIPGFPFVRFHDDLVLSWVWGFSFRKQQPILIPEQAVYYDSTYYPRDSLFVLECSSGCAIGGALGEAIFYGLLEVLERDAVLRTWYGRKSPIPLDLESVTDRDLNLQIDRFQMVSGYKLHAFDVTAEFGIPSVWLVAVNPRDDGHKALNTSNTHPDPLIALEGALGEMAGTLFYHRKEGIEKREKLLKMIAEPRLVMDRLDHSLTAGLPESFPRLQFLFEREAEKRSLREAFPNRRIRPGDLAVAAREAIDAVLRAGFDVLTVDQTPPEQEALGLKTAKVLVPGLLPMSYCNLLRRTQTARLGSEGDLNPFPHPFA